MKTNSSKVGGIHEQGSDDGRVGGHVSHAGFRLFGILGRSLFKFASIRYPTTDPATTFRATLNGPSYASCEMFESETCQKRRSMTRCSYSRESVRTQSIPANPQSHSNHVRSKTGKQFALLFHNKK